MEEIKGGKVEGMRRKLGKRSEGRKSKRKRRKMKEGELSKVRGNNRRGDRGCERKCAEWK